LGANPIVSGPDVFRDAEVECVAPYVPFEEALRDADVVMMLRIQRERLEENLAWEMDDYLHQYGLTEKRLELLKQAEAIIMDEMPVIPIYFYTYNWVQNENLKNVSVTGLGDIQFKWAYFE
ncbi:MAG: hypothetical protein LOD92_06240, partial [Bacillales bacterium]